MPRKPPPPPPSDAQIAVAAKSNYMRALVAVAKAFGSAGVKGPFTVALPQLVQGWVTEKNGYRKISINAGARFDVERITLGKKAGILFCFKPMDAVVAEKDNPAWIELEWDDVVNAFGDLADDVDARAMVAVASTVSTVNDQTKQTINANPAMHAVLKAGFERAYAQASERALTEYDEALPGFGMF